MRLIAVCGPIALLLGVLTPASAGQSPSACQLISQADVERTLHISTSHGNLRLNSKALTSCSFRAGRDGTVTIILYRNGSEDWIAARKRLLSSSPSFRPTSGMGNLAFVLDRSEQGAALCVFGEEYYLQLTVLRLGAADVVLPKIEELARKALTRR